jgi:acetyl esterase/lipase
MDIKHWLDWLPRVRLRGWFDYALLQFLLRFAQLIVGEVPGIERRWAGVWLRVQRPAHCKGVVLDFHGGAFVNGNAQMNDRPNRDLMQREQLAVISVDYRLVGRHSFEIMLDDCRTAILWLAANVQQEFGCDGFCVMGESAGAYLALQSLLTLPTPAVCQGALLYYGVYDLEGTPSLLAAPRNSMLLSIEDLRTLPARLLPGRDLRAFSPIHADLDSLPPALLVVGGCDALRDDSRLLAKRWPGAELLEVPDSPHGFNRFGTAVARQTRDYAHAWLRQRMKT